MFITQWPLSLYRLFPSISYHKLWLSRLFWCIGSETAIAGLISQPHAFFHGIYRLINHGNRELSAGPPGAHVPGCHRIHLAVIMAPLLPFSISPGLADWQLQMAVNFWPSCHQSCCWVCQGRGRIRQGTRLPQGHIARGTEGTAKGQGHHQVTQHCLRALLSGVPQQSLYLFPVNKIQFVQFSIACQSW